MRQPRPLLPGRAAIACVFAAACASAPAKAPAPATPPAQAPPAAPAPAPTPPPFAPPPEASGPPPADQAEAIRRWHALTGAKNTPAARALCESWLPSPTRWLAAEGHRCLAQIAMMRPERYRREGGPHGGIIGPAGAKADEAIDHLTKAIALVPDDVSTHLGRLHVAINSDHPDRAPKLLADSLQTYTGPDALADWLEYAQGLVGAGGIGLDFMRVLEKKYPDDHRVVGNIGTFLVLLERRSEALPYLRRAVELAPKDAIDSWNLGRFYEQQGDMKSAEPLLRKAVSLETDAERRREMSCNLARALSERPASRAEGCAMARKPCDMRPPACKR
jgi:tetratricopeptide (TPR) repeat protein